MGEVIEGETATRREILRIVEKQSGITPDELKPVPLPDQMQFAWRAFLDLALSRPNYGMGVSAIPYVEIKAWSELTGNNLSHFDIAAIKAVDRAYLEYRAKSVKRTEK